jgi:prepilin-type N-terminal cleavage/methylation domain-containing protein
MNIKKEKGFTLIEILIVVAIIAILASIVIVGVGPAQQSGRDARRVADLQDIRNGLQLFYDKCGFYPGTAAPTCTDGSAGATWTGSSGSFQSALEGAGIGINVGNVPQDPSTNRTYGYAPSSDNTSYVIGAVLENPTNAVFTNYTAPTNIGSSWSEDATTIAPNKDCKSAQTYCVTL